MSKARIHVLLVDDDDSIRLAAEHILSSANNFEVTTCASGEEAIEELSRGGIDVMVLDQKMPGMTGLNVLQWMHERKQVVPTLMLTGEGSEHIAVEALKMGAYDYIRKDHLELRRLPIVVSGIFERKLFREDRARREQEQVRAEERRTIEYSLREAIGFLGERVSESYMEAYRLLQEAELASKEAARPDRTEKTDAAFQNLREALDRLVTDIRSLLDQTYFLQSNAPPLRMPGETRNAKDPNAKQDRNQRSEKGK